MSEFDWDNFEDDDTEDPTPQTLNPQLPKELRRVIRDLKKSEKEATERAVNLERQLRTNTVTGVLAARAVPAKVANLIPSDVDATPEAIGKWLDDYGDVFGIQQTANESGQTVSNGAAGTVTTSQPNADISAMQRMQQTAASGDLFSAQQALMTKLTDPALTKEQLEALIAGAA